MKHPHPPVTRRKQDVSAEEKMVRLGRTLKSGYFKSWGGLKRAGTDRAGTEFLYSLSANISGDWTRPGWREEGKVTKPINGEREVNRMF